MKIKSADGSDLVQVNALERDGEMLVIRGRIMGAMPMTARLSPSEFREGLRLLNFRLILFLLIFPFRGWGKG